MVIHYGSINRDCNGSSRYEYGKASNTTDFNNLYTYFAFGFAAIRLVGSMFVKGKDVN
ncbi:hypothetical protein [Segetibacter koreensis]|uniref:hypothetical protein n=1 Tax=Segetibacter koreensis TaxID=398037 RepID=UPI00036E9831|nr:hypothetical protein [Segetibacter koreensis]